MIGSQHLSLFTESPKPGVSTHDKLSWTPDSRTVMRVCSTWSDHADYYLRPITSVQVIKLVKRPEVNPLKIEQSAVPLSLYLFYYLISPLTFDVFLTRWDGPGYSTP